jgi:hypothetical protein
LGRHLATTSIHDARPSDAGSGTGVWETEAGVQSGGGSGCSEQRMADVGGLLVGPPPTREAVVRAP